jgi:hypothetical protein
VGQLGRAAAWFNVEMPPTDAADFTQLPGWQELPADLQKVFADAHLPATFLRRSEDSANFVAGPDLQQIDVPPRGRLVQFGRRVGGYGGRFCLDRATGEVVLLWRPEAQSFVNSTLDLMARTIRLALDFTEPFVTGSAEERWIAAEDFREALRQVDRPAAASDSYWGLFALDGESGAYSTNEDPFGDDEDF